MAIYALSAYFAADGKFTIEIKGLDIYDPTTEQVRSNSTEDIACWFIDTDYNGESFFVRHTYFIDGEDKCERLKKTLKAEIDESVWHSLYGTVSRPLCPTENRQDSHQSHQPLRG